MTNPERNRSRRTVRVTTIPRRRTAVRDEQKARATKQSYWLHLLQQHAGARQAFARDLAIAFVAVLLLSVNFLRGVNLFEQVTSVESQVEAAAAVAAVKDSLLVNDVGLAPLTFHSGQQRLTRQFSCAFEERLLALQRAVKEQPSDGPDTAAPTSTPCSDAIGAPIPLDMLLDLPLSDRRGLAAADEDLVLRLLEENVVAPLNDAFPRARYELVYLPLQQSISHLKTLVKQEQDAISDDEDLAHLSDELRDTSKKLGLLTEKLSNSGHAMDAGPLAAERIAAVLPTGVTAAAILADPSHNEAMGVLAALEVGQGLAQLDAAFAGVAGADLTTTFLQIETTLSNVREARPDAPGLQAHRDGLRAKLQSIEAIYTGPLPGTISLMPEETVRYFPVVLALVLAFFVWRFLQLQHRTEALVKAFEEQGEFDQDEAQLYLPPLTRFGPRAMETRAQRATAFASIAVGVAILLGIGIAIAFAARMALSRTDASVHTAWLYLTYLFAGLLVVWAYGLLAMEALFKSGISGGSGSVLGDGILRAPVVRQLSGARSPSGRDRQGSVRVLVAVVLVVGAVGTIGLLGGGAALGASSGPTPHARFVLEAGEPVATLGAFLRQQEQAAPQPRGFENAELRESVGLRLRLEGRAEVPKGQRLRVRWTMFEAATDRPVAAPFFLSQPAFPTPIYVPLANEESHSVELWVPSPAAPGRYYVKVQLAEGDRVLFDEPSPAFLVT